jgi:hypothetical protein
MYLGSFSEESAMSQADLEHRVARLEKLVDGLVRHGNRYPAQGRDWRSTVGMFKGDPVMKEICDEALRTRDEERRRFHEPDPPADCK